jgi:hypothetical protein
VDVHISSLRDKIDRDFPQKLIKTNRGIGCTFVDPLLAPMEGEAGLKTHVA